MRSLLLWGRGWDGIPCQINIIRHLSVQCHNLLTPTTNCTVFSTQTVSSYQNYSAQNQSLVLRPESPAHLRRPHFWRRNLLQAFGLVKMLQSLFHCFNSVITPDNQSVKYCFVIRWRVRVQMVQSSCLRICSSTNNSLDCNIIWVRINRSGPNPVLFNGCTETIQYETCHDFILE